MTQTKKDAPAKNKDQLKKKYAVEKETGDDLISEGVGTFFSTAITFIVYIYIYVKLKNIKDF